MEWRSQDILAAARAGDFGEVIRLARVGVGMPQRELCGLLGLSQPALSRMEARGTRPYRMATLELAAAHLGIPHHLLGLADRGTTARDGTDDVERRRFLGSALAAAAAPALAVASGTTEHGSQAATLRVSTSAYRRLDATTPSRELATVVHAHLGLIKSITASAPGTERHRLAAVGSEASSLAAWLAWDMGDYGSARTWYGAAVRTARTGSDPLLTSYQLGSLAQLEAHAGNGALALNLSNRARRALSDESPIIADAWLSTVEALAHAAAGDERRSDKALVRARAAAESIAGSGEAPPWPWVFAFDASKVDACRVTCGAMLALPAWVFSVPPPLAGHAKQQALTWLDLAAGHLAAGQVDAAFSLGSRALTQGLQYRSGRVVERARVLRRSYITHSPARIVRDFDERLHSVYL